MSGETGDLQPEQSDVPQDGAQDNKGESGPAMSDAAILSMQGTPQEAAEPASPDVPPEEAASTAEAPDADTPNPDGSEIGPFSHRSHEHEVLSSQERDKGENVPREGAPLGETAEGKRPREKDEAESEFRGFGGGPERGW